MSKLSCSCSPVDTNSGNTGTIEFQGSIHGNSGGNVTDITSIDGGGAAVTLNAIDTNIEDIFQNGENLTQAEQLSQYKKDGFLIVENFLYYAIVFTSADLSRIAGRFKKPAK